MESFAAVVRSLLVRIRAFQASRSGSPWPPPGVASRGASLYRVAPTAWGLDTAGAARDDGATVAAAIRPSARSASRRRRPLELTVYGLPVPRGLPAT